MKVTTTRMVVMALEVDATQEVPLAVFYPQGHVEVVDRTGTMLIQFSSRPLFAPLTEQEVSRVLAVLRTGGATAPLPSSDQSPVPSLITDWGTLSDESET